MSSYFLSSPSSLSYYLHLHFMSPVANISSDLSTHSHHHQLTTLHSKFEKLNEIYQCCTAQYYYKNDKIFKPAMFDNFVAGFSKFPPSAAWKLSDIYAAARKTFDTTWKEKKKAYELNGKYSATECKKCMKSAQRMCCFTHMTLLRLEGSTAEEKTTSVGTQSCFL